MHCRSWTNAQGHLGKACYVTNYGRDNTGKVAFGQDPDTSINQAIAQSNPIATVAHGGPAQLVTPQADPDPLLDGLESSAYLAVPLKVQHRPIGALVLERFLPRERCPSPESLGGEDRQ